MKVDLIERLEGVAKSIENRIGRHPEADAVREAIEALKDKGETEAPAPKARAKKAE